MTKSMFRVLGVVASLVVAGASVAADAPAVEWKVIDGGNGHWYQGVVVSTEGASWTKARAFAVARGADLAVVPSVVFADWLFNNTVNNNSLWCENGGPWVGGYQEAGSAEPGGGWKWVDGSSILPAVWSVGQPDNATDCGGDNNRMGYWNGGQSVPRPYLEDSPDLAVVPCVGPKISAIIEYSADCNGDGSVDYGQIQSGELADTNHNNIPDVCEIHVTYVQPISGSASGGTPVNINGMNFPTTVSVLFGGVAATDVVVVSSTVITAVTPVGVPGMTVVTVNGVGGEAFYYRSNCQSDLDGSGGVDSSDLGILLLDFGSCGDSAAVAPQPEPLILQSVETPTPVLNKK